MILVEATAAVDAAGTLKTFYLSTGQYATNPSDTPANQPFTGALKDPGSIGVSVFGSGRTAGVGSLQVGAITLTNNDGTFDPWLAYGFDGRPVIIRRFIAGMTYSAMPILFTGTVDGPAEITRKLITLRLKDKQQVLDVQACQNVYGGTNVPPNGVDGTGNDLKGRPKARIYGKVVNITQDCVNTSKLTYQVNDGAVTDISAVYDRGAALTKGSDYATSALLNAATVSAGSYATCFAEGMFRLGSSPAGQITCDALEGGVAVTNLVLQSQTMDNASWQKFGSGTTVTANTDVAPDATTTADTFTGGAADSAIATSSMSLASGFTGNASVWLKCNAGARNVNMYVVRNGVVQVFGPKVCAVTTTWQRFDLDFTTTAADTYYIQIGGGSTVGVGVAVQAWGAQLSPGSGVQPYVPTTTTTVTAATPMRTAASIIRALALLAGLTTAEVSTADVTAMNSLQPTTSIGIQINGTTTIRTAINQIAASVGGWSVFDPTGVLRMGILVEPAGTPALSISGSQGISIERVAQKDGDLPIYALQLNHTHNYTQQSSDLAGSVTADRRAFLALTDRASTSIDITIKNRYLLAPLITVDSLLVDILNASGGVAATESARQLALYKVKRDMFQIEVSFDVLGSVVPTLMSLVKLTDQRFGLSGGRLFWLLGFTLTLAKNRATLILWG